MPDKVEIKNKETVTSSCKILMSATAFKTSTKVGMTFGGKRRTNEKLLTFIDTKLTYINKIQTKKPNASLGPDAMLVLAELYYALDRWLVLAGRKDSSVNTRRSKGVNGLFAQVVKLLSFQLEMPMNRLPNWLGEHFTVGMTDHGYEVDYKNRSALYYKEQDREVYRLKITNGVVYQKKWWDPKNKDTWVKMNSEFTQSTGSAGTISNKHSGYVLSIVGDFYSGPHKSGTTYKKTGQYHSSYMGGKPVLCAGEIEVVDGKIKHLNTGSGHYGPAKGYLLNVINALTVCGVSETSYMVDFHGSKSSVSAAKMRKKIETEEVKVGGDDVSHLKSAEAASRLNGVKAGLLARIKKLRGELDVIAHFKTSDHVEGFKRRRAICKICGTNNLDNKMQQDRYRNRNVREREVKLEALQKQVAFIK